VMRSAANEIFNKAGISIRQTAKRIFFLFCLFAASAANG